MLDCQFQFILEKKLKRLKKKNKKSFDNVKKKILEILNNSPETIDKYKNLKKPLNKFKRVHINNSFVLIFSYDWNDKKIVFEDYEHHDVIYSRK